MIAAAQMATIPLEDNFTDIIGKAQRGFNLSDADLARRAGISLDELQRVKAGEVDEPLIRKIARSLNLGKTTLVESAKKGWYPQPQGIPGLAQLNTVYGDMTVNAYLAWDPAGKEAAVFDTGADSSPVLDAIKANGLTVKYLLLTHTHPDHVAELARLKAETKAPAFVGEREPIDGAETFAEGKTFQLGNLRIDTRLTWGHSRGGITYVVWGLQVPVAIAGDALFAGSMGGGMVSYEDALRNNREKILSLPDDTVVCCGHGPMTTVGEEKLHNPFFLELGR